ncbi:hypothetical protein EQ500_13565, partial [Lactobacillus sp. XV13L]|nr:hypothetical protein [Lactobacillus sp. XV13L]
MPLKQANFLKQTAQSLATMNLQDLLKLQQTIRKLESQIQSTITINPQLTMNIAFILAFTSLFMETQSEKIGSFFMMHPCDQEPEHFDYKLLNSISHLADQLVIFLKTSDLDSKSRTEMEKITDRVYLLNNPISASSTSVEGLR